MKFYILCVGLLFGMSSAAAFLPKHAYFCEARGEKDGIVYSVKGGAGVNDVEASDMAMYQCEDIHNLQNCRIQSCWLVL